MKDDLYKELNLDRNASQEDITNAYKKLAKKHHPDMPGGNAEKFKKIANAYDTLKDTEKRKMYDMTGSSDGAGFGGFQQTNFGDSDFFNNVFNFNFDGGGFSSFFSGNSNKQPVRGRDIQIKDTITLEELFYGKNIDISFDTYAHCDTCKASGYTGKSSCSHCKGRGYTENMFDFFQYRKPCEYCHQTGQNSKDICKTCKGEGRTRQKVHHKLKVPKGYDMNKPLSYVGLGEAGVRSSKNSEFDGNLILVLGLQKHKTFTKNGADLFMDYKIDLRSALLGTEIHITSIDSEVYKVKVDPIKGNTSITIENAGFWLSHNTNRRGHLIVNLQIELPKLSDNGTITQFNTFWACIK